MNMEEIDKSIDSFVLDIYSMLRIESESNFVQMVPQTQLTNFEFNQAIRTNHDEPIRQSSEGPQHIRPVLKKRPPPLQTITNSTERHFLLNIKPTTSRQVSSAASQQLSENRQPSSRTVQTLMEGNQSIVNCPSNTPSEFMLLPWSPMAVTQKSRKGIQHICKHNWKEEGAPEPAFPSNIPANPVSPNVCSALVAANSKRWTKQADKLLANAIECQKGQVYDWDLIASKFFAGSRSGASCRSRWSKDIACDRILGKWKPAEDAKILELRAEGFTWRDIAMLCPGRCHKQVQCRYNNNLDPSLLKTPWTAAEDSILVEEQSRIGNKWAQISLLLPGRSKDQIKNRWYQKHTRSGLGKRNKSSSAKKSFVKKTSQQVRSPHNSHFDFSPVKTPYGTEADDSRLIQKQPRNGNQLGQISRLLAGRNRDQVKNRWHKKQEKARLGKQTKTSSAKARSEQVRSCHTDHPESSTVKTPCWTKAEDSILIQEQSRIGNKWKQISLLLPGRSSDQVRNRYRKTKILGHGKQTKSSPAKKVREQVRSHNDHFDVSVLQAPFWTETEDSILIQEHSRVGNKWAQISQLLPGRSSDQVKNRWHNNLRKQTKASR